MVNVMDGFEDDDVAGAEGEYAWRETYFVLMRADARPTLTQVEATLGETGGDRWTIENLRANNDGQFESLLVRAPEDHAALEVRYEAGDTVQEQALELVTNLGDDLSVEDRTQIVQSDARLDVLHLEQLGGSSGDGADLGGELDSDEFDEADILGEGLDPGTLLMVVEALAKLTDGLPFDPAAGEVLT